ncbi:STAS domain-containing protein [Cryptosporangium aurantiacum]|uniref:Anti-anti-sigma factor n=1 Tax=Cryptosporangium aurantiacum TaxID=134849 RepID=A0A1M7H6R3_9ACTN|nr:STAS domain-containing protein [Cryptosporangium aurantiacum]SHM24053.1 anti-anti-sigma factor [Cryptosporangium aurantiacum]
MSTPLHIATGQSADGRWQLTATGEIDLSNAAMFRDQLAAAVHPGPRLIVDLTGVEYLDSAALAALFTHADRIEVLIAPLNEYLLTVCGLTQLTEVRVIPATPSAAEHSE